MHTITHACMCVCFIYIFYPYYHAHLGMCVCCIFFYYYYYAHTGMCVLYLFFYPYFHAHTGMCVLYLFLLSLSYTQHNENAHSSKATAPSPRIPTRETSESDGEAGGGGARGAIIHSSNDVALRPRYFIAFRVS